MSRIMLLVMSALLFAGCAHKPAAPVEPAPQAVEPQSPAPAAEPAAAASTSVTVTTVDGSALETVFFAYDSAVLQPAAREVLQRNAAWLQANPQAAITIEGHCDERGTEEYNLALGERRARAAYEHLVILGVDPQRMSIVSFGEERPIDPAHNETAWAKNRRAEFVVQ